MSEALRRPTTPYPSVVVPPAARARRPFSDYAETASARTDGPFWLGGCVFASGGSRSSYDHKPWSHQLREVPGSPVQSAHFFREMGGRHNARPQRLHCKRVARPFRATWFANGMLFCRAPHPSWAGAHSTNRQPYFSHRPRARFFSRRRFRRTGERRVGLPPIVMGELNRDAGPISGPVDACAVCAAAGSPPIPDHARKAVVHWASTANCDGADPNWSVAILKAPALDMILQTVASATYVKSAGREPCTVPGDPRPQTYARLAGHGRRFALPSCFRPRSKNPGLHPAGPPSSTDARRAGVQSNTDRSTTRRRPGSTNLLPTKVTSISCFVALAVSEGRAHRQSTQRAAGRELTERRPPPALVAAGPRLPDPGALCPRGRMAPQFDGDSSCALSQ